MERSECHVSVFIAAVVFVQNDAKPTERPARSAAFIPTAWLPPGAEDGIPLLLAAPGQINQAPTQSE